jgi:hypothetical protein
VEEAWSRGRWLLGLLVLQSMSSFVLDSYQELIQDHLVVTLFLTMLVGAGGNAGNQSAIKVIRGLATGSLKPTTAGIRRAMQQQLAVGLMLGVGLAAGGWLRVYVTNGNALNATAISVSLFLIVLTSVLAGTGGRWGEGGGGAQGGGRSAGGTALAIYSWHGASSHLPVRLPLKPPPPVAPPPPQGCPLRWPRRVWTPPTRAPASR